MAAVTLYGFKTPQKIAAGRVRCGAVDRELYYGCARCDEAAATLAGCGTLGEAPLPDLSNVVVIEAPGGARLALYCAACIEALCADEAAAA